MSRLLKRWESPRKEGRNSKGRGGSARKRQLKKQQNQLRQKLKAKGREINLFPFCFSIYGVTSASPLPDVMIVSTILSGSSITAIPSGTFN
jgi:hypothetical protein